jgi:hypothetical protein
MHTEPEEFERDHGYCQPQAIPGQTSGVPYEEQPPADPQLMQPEPGAAPPAPSPAPTDDPLDDTPAVAPPPNAADPSTGPMLRQVEFAPELESAPESDVEEVPELPQIQPRD